MQSADELLSRLHEPTGPLPVAEPANAAAWPWVVGLLALALLAACWRARRRPRTGDVPPADAALTALPLLADQPPAEAAERLDRLIRQYLGATHGMPALRMTTPEIAEALAGDRCRHWRVILADLSDVRFGGGAIPTDRMTELIRRTHAAIQSDNGNLSDGGGG